MWLIAVGSAMRPPMPLPPPPFRRSLGQALGSSVCMLSKRTHCRRRIAECCAHSIPRLLSPPPQSSLAPAVAETANFAGIFPHAIPEDAGRLLATHVGDKRAAGNNQSARGRHDLAVLSWILTVADSARKLLQLLKMLHEPCCLC